MMELPSATFFRLAERLPAFPGVIQARLRQEAAQERPGAPVASAPTPADQRQALRSYGAEVATAPTAAPSYLHDRLKGARP